MPFFELNHQSNHPKCSGNPGDVVEVDQETADLFIGRGGGKLVEAETATAPKSTGKKSDESGPDPDTDAGNDSDANKDDDAKSNAKKSAKK